MSQHEDAAADHAVMAEQLLDQAASSIEQAEQAEGRGAFEAASIFRQNANTAIAAAQVHATLATIPAPVTTFEAVLDTTPDAPAWPHRRTDPDIRQGDRVVLLQPSTMNRREFPVIGNDTIGTVVSISPDADARALVDWDDLHQQADVPPIPVSQLRVVLGA